MPGLSGNQGKREHWIHIHILHREQTFFHSQRRNVLPVLQVSPRARYKSFSEPSSSKLLAKTRLFVGKERIAGQLGSPNLTLVA